jgi:hypothetical protein
VGHVVQLFSFFSLDAPEYRLVSPIHNSVSSSYCASFGAKSGTVFISLRSQDVNKKRHLQGRVWVNSISGELVWVTVNGSVDLPSASADMFFYRRGRAIITTFFLHILSGLDEKLVTK